MVSAVAAVAVGAGPTAAAARRRRWEGGERGRNRQVGWGLEAEAARGEGAKTAVAGWTESAVSGVSGAGDPRCVCDRVKSRIQAECDSTELRVGRVWNKKVPTPPSRERELRSLICHDTVMTDSQRMGGQF